MKKIADVMIPELRYKYIGASDAAVVLGESPFKKPYQLWLEKVNEVSLTFSTPQMQLGQKMEAVIIEKLRRLGHDVIPNCATFADDTYPFIAATPDAFVNDGEAGGEIKVSTLEMDDIPTHYDIQVQQQMGVMGWDWVLFVAVDANTLREDMTIDELELKTLVIPRNQSLIDLIWRENVKFWQCIQDKTPPNQKIIEVDAKLEELLENYRDTRDVLKQVKKRHDDAADALKSYLGDATVVVNPGSLEPIATYDSYVRKDFDGTTFSKDYPDLFKKYKVASEVRTLRVK